MAVTGWSASNYLHYDTTGLYVTRPFFISVWFNIPSTPGATGVVFESANGGVYEQIYLNTTPEPRIFDSGNTTFEDVGSTVVPTTNAWHLITAYFVSSTSRQVACDETKGTGTTDTGTTTAPNQNRIGVDHNSANPFHSTGGIAEVSLWGGSMSAANMDSLTSKLFDGGAGGAGGNPLNITAESSQPWSGQLKTYWTINNNTDLSDKSGGSKTLTLVGSLSNFASHPNIESVSGGGALIGSQFSIGTRWARAS